MGLGSQDRKLPRSSPGRGRQPGSSNGFHLLPHIEDRDGTEMGLVHPEDGVKVAWSLPVPLGQAPVLGIGVHDIPWDSQKPLEPLPNLRDGPEQGPCLPSQTRSGHTVHPCAHSSVRSLHRKSQITAGVIFKVPNTWDISVN